MDFPLEKVCVMPKNIRIMVVTPMYGGSLPISHYCAEALEKLGYSVRIFDAAALYPGYAGIRELDLAPSRAASLQKSFLKFVSQAIWAQAEEQRPRLVLALAQAPVDKTLLLKLKRAGAITAMWFVEDYKVFNYWKWMAPLFDAFATIQKEPFLSTLKDIGQEHAFYLPLAASPDFHKPLKLTPKERAEYGSEISFLGAGYPNRRLAFRGLADRDFKIWGSDWDGETELAKNIQRGGARISADESVKIYNAAKININLHSSLNPATLVSEGDFVNPRTFELGAMGAFQLTDRRALASELFEPDELAVFDNMDEFYQKLDYFLAHPEKREEYAAKTRARVLASHTYEKRMETLLDYLRENFPDIDREEPEDESLKNLPPELAEKLGELTAKLGLASNAPFEDIVARLRRERGALSDIETAILFLDEWRKQYS